MTIDKPDPLTRIKKEHAEISPAHRSFRQVLSPDTWPKRLLLAAALLHIMVTVGLHVAGRTQMAPNLIDPDGIMPSFASDSYTYRQPAILLSAVLKEHGIRA